MKKDPSKFDFTVRPKGETSVWLTAAGLALGTLMVLGLLGLVFVEGFKVFWPSDVIEVTLKGDSSFAQNGHVIAGTITKKQKKLRGGAEEWQLFLGNKDAYGFGFKYIDHAHIESIQKPLDIVVAERTEYGDAIFYPQKITLNASESVSIDHQDFFKVFENQLQIIDQRRDEIYTIEKVEIGEINRKMELLQQKKKSLDPASLETESILNSLAELQTKYEVLASSAKVLRNQQDLSTLEYQLPTGEERSLSLGNFIRIHRPNQMNVFEKIGHFFAEIYRFLTERPREANTEGGIFPAIFGTFIMTVLMSAAVMPFGVIAAIYLREYASQGALVQATRIAVNNLAGVPSIVFGVFGLGFFVYFLGGSIDQLFFSDRLPTATFGTGGILWASLTLALMTVPVVIVATEEALAAVPRGAREASLACGASKWQTIQRIVLPVSAPGILTGLILAMARGAGEVAPLMLVGVVKLAPSLPIDGLFPFVHFERKFMHLGFHIYDLGFQSPDSEAARPMVFATTLLLIILVIFLNLGAIFLRNHLRKKYTSSSF